MTDQASLRLHGVLAAAVLWIGAAWLLSTPGPLDRFGQPKLPDFAQFYVAGRLIHDGQIDALYNWSAFAHALHRDMPWVPDEASYVSVYPPHVALAFAALAPLGVWGSAVAWSLFTLGLYALGVWLLTRRVPRPVRITLLLLAVANPALQQTLLFGQVSAVAFVFVALAAVCAGADRWWLAGLALGGLAFKPPLLSVAAVMCLLLPSWSLVAGVLVSVLVQAAIVGSIEPWIAYARTIQSVLIVPEVFEPKPYQLHSLKGMFDYLIGRSAWSLALWAAGAALTIWLAWRAINGRRDLSAFATAVVAGVLLSPHLYIYDLLVLTVPLAIWAGEALRRPVRLADNLAYALYWMPLVGPLTAFTGAPITPPLALTFLGTCRPRQATSTEANQ